MRYNNNLGWAEISYSPTGSITIDAGSGLYGEAQQYGAFNSLEKGAYTKICWEISECLGDRAAHSSTYSYPGMLAIALSNKSGESALGSYYTPRPLVISNIPVDDVSYGISGSAAIPSHVEGIFTVTIMVSACRATFAGLWLE